MGELYREEDHITTEEKAYLEGYNDAMAKAKHRYVDLEYFGLLFVVIFMGIYPMLAGGVAGIVLPALTSIAIWGIIIKGKFFQ